MDERTAPSAGRVGRLGDAFADLLDQEFDWSAGHLATLLSGCVFAPSLLTFWFVNGVLDFSTAVLIGSVSGPAGLGVRLLAYLLLVPTFLFLRVGYYLLHPGHRRTVPSGACPQSDLLSLDWFSVGILATGLPLALANLGPWLGMNLVFLVGVFVLPRLLTAERLQSGSKVVAIGAGSLLFLYANYGGPLAAGSPIPDPAMVLGPVATLTLTDATVEFLFRVANSLLAGPIAVAIAAYGMNRLLTRPELTSIPLVRHSLPRRDPARTVLSSAALGTGFYLAVVAVATGRLVVVP
jgi:hypothetical protein